jgi:hypothetical protein
MYIDRLTVIALIIFVVALYLFIRFCRYKVCSVESTGAQVPSEPPKAGKS